MSIDEIKQKLPGFDWDKYLTARGAATATHINIAQPSAIAEAIKIMNDTDIDLIRDYLKFRIIEAADTLLDDKTYAISFDFYNRTIAGQKEQKTKNGTCPGHTGQHTGRRNRTYLYQRILPARG